MSFFRRLLKGPKRSGQVVLDEALEHTTSLATALSMPSDLATHLAERGEAFTDAGEVSVLVGAFLVFGEEALKVGPYARRILEDLQRRDIDVATMHEVEFMVLMTALNVLLTAEAVARSVSGIAESQQLDSVQALFFDEADPRRDMALQILEFAEMAQSVRLHRGLHSPDYVSDFLERRIRPDIPISILEPSARTFAELRGT